METMNRNIFNSKLPTATKVFSMIISQDRFAKMLLKVMQLLTMQLATISASFNTLMPKIIQDTQ